MRLYEPDVGQEIFASVQDKISRSYGGNLRLEEMMSGEERRLLEDAIWGETAVKGWETELSSADGLFIPKGWWHSIKGVGKGMIGSVSVISPW